MKSIFKIAYIAIKSGKTFYAFAEACDVFQAGYVFTATHPEIPDECILAIIRGKKVKTLKGE